MPQEKQTTLARFALALVHFSRWRALWAVVIGSALLGLLWVPPVCVVPTVLALPVLLTFPEFSHTGKYVTYWFLGFIPKNSPTFIFFLIYYSFVAYFLLFPLGWYSLQKNKNSMGGAHEQKTTAPDDTSKSS